MTNASFPLVAVCGATGQQGRAVVRRLLARRRYGVRALTRQPNGAVAKELAASGVNVVAADFDNPESLQAAFAGAYGVFGVTQPWSADYRHVDMAKEIAHGKNIAEAAEKAGVKHVVFSTVMKVQDEPTGIPHVDSKREIEAAVAGRSVPYTFLRPGTFMDNIGQAFFPVKKNKVTGFCDGDAKLPFVAVHDIGEAAALLFEQTEIYKNRGLNLVGEFASGEELAATLGRLRGKKFRYKSTPALLMRLLVPEFYKMRRGFEEDGRPPYKHKAVIEKALAETRALNPLAWNLEGYLRETRLGM